MNAYEHDWDEYEQDIKGWSNERIEKELEMLENDLANEILDPESFDAAMEIIERVVSERMDHSDAYDRAVSIL